MLTDTHRPARRKVNQEKAKYTLDSCSAGMTAAAGLLYLLSVLDLAVLQPMGNALSRLARGLPPFPFDLGRNLSTEFTSFHRWGLVLAASALLVGTSMVRDRRGAASLTKAVPLKRWAACSFAFYAVNQMYYLPTSLAGLAEWGARVLMAMLAGSIAAFAVLPIVRLAMEHFRSS